MLLQPRRQQMHRYLFLLDTPVRWRLALQIEPAGALGSGELSWRLSNGRAIVGNSEVLTGSCRGLVHEQGLRLRKLAAKARAS